MSPAAYMVVGGICGGFILAIAIVIGEASVLAMAFGAGTLFGKGYGVWEERTRRTLKEQGR